MYCTSIIWPKIIIDGWPFGTILSLEFFPSFSCGSLFTTFSFGEKKRHRIKMPMVGGNWGYVFFVAEKIEIPMLLISNDVVMTAWQGFAFWRYHGDSKIPRHPTMVSFYTSKDLKKSPLTSTPHRPSHWIKMRKKTILRRYDPIAGRIDRIDPNDPYHQFHWFTGTFCSCCLLLTCPAVSPGHGSLGGFFWRICASKWIISPIFRVKIPKTFKQPPHRWSSSNWYCYHFVHKQPPNRKNL